MRDVVGPFVRCLIVLVVLAIGGRAVAQERSSPAELAGKAADAVSEAIAGGDDDALAKLAAQDNPDAWNVTDVLLGRGRFDDALALAKACSGPDTEKLAAYVASRKDKPYDTAARTACDTAQAALEAQDVAALKAALEGASSDGYLGARIQLYSALARMMSGELAECATAGQVAADAAKALGWIKAEAGILVPIGNALARTGDMQGAVAAWERALTIQEQRKDVQGALGAVRGLAAVAGRSGDQLGSLGYMERLSAVAEAAGDDTMLAGILVDVGNTYGRLGKVEKARELLTRGLAACEKIGRHDWAVNALTGLANLHQTAGELAACAALFVRAAGKMKEAGNTREAVKLLTHAGKQQRDAGELAAAKDTFLQAREWGEETGDDATVLQADAALVIADKMLGNLDAALTRATDALPRAEASGDKATLTALVSAIGLIHEDRGELDEASTFLERTLALSRETGDKARESGTLVNLGIVLHRRGELDRAMELFERGRALANETGQRQFEANAYTNIAAIHEQRDQLHLAREALEKAAAVIEGVGDPLALAANLARRGGLAIREHDVGLAIELLQHAVEIEEKAGARLSAAQSLTNLAEAFRRAGDEESSRRHSDRAIELFEEIGDTAAIAIPLNTVALLEANRGRIGKAFEMLERAVSATRSAGDIETEIAALLNLSTLQSRVGQHEAALASTLTAEKRNEKLGSSETASKLALHRAILLKQLARYDEAREAVEQVLRLAVEQNRPTELPGAHATLASIHAGQGRLDEAIASAKTSVELARASGHALSLARALGGLGSFQFASGDLDGARATFEESVSLARETAAVDLECAGLGHLAAFHARDGEYEKAVAVSRDVSDKLPLVIAGLADEQAALAGDSWTAVQGVGIRAALELGSVEDALYLAERTRSWSLLESLGGRSFLANAMLPPELAAEEREVQSSMLAARARMSAARASGRLKDVRAAKKELEAAQARSIAVLERIQRTRRAAGATIDTTPATVAEIQASLDTNDALVSYALLDDGRAAAVVITKKDARLVGLANLGEAVGSPDTPEFVSSDAKLLRPLLVDPLKLDAEVRRVFVSPVGELAYIPFARLLGERDVVFVPSATLLATLGGDDAAAGEGVLALGDPVYDAKRDTKAVAALRGGELAPLPGTRAEVKAVATVPLLGDKATETEFAAAVARSKRWRAVHFACHGLVDAERPLLSSLAITPDAASDGFLTVGEILRLRIPADLVVLSACETGRGKVYASEGVVGFTRAFLLAGSPRVIVSLWKVDDEATRVLMTTFYELWKTKSAATALREAQRFVASQEKWADPKYWAAWQLWGLP